jgi:hypothetical protein
VPPIYLKDFNRPVFRRLWRRGTDVLSTPKKLPVLEYSLPATDLDAQCTFPVRLDAGAHGRYVPAAARRSRLTVLPARDLRFVISGHTHQARTLEVDGVEHMWVPSTAYYIPDSIQERIGDEIVGVATLELSDTGHHFAVTTPDGLVKHSLAHFPEVYPSLAGIRPTSPAGGACDLRDRGGAGPAVS